MTDILNLLDVAIPLQKRYDTFLEWDNQNAVVSINLISEKLGVGVAHVEVFFELGKVETEEFRLIDINKVTIDSLVLIIKEDEDLRFKIYNDYKSIINSSQPVRALKTYIDNQIAPSFEEIINEVSPSALISISKYLKQTGIENGTINKSFRSFLITCSKTLKSKNLSSKQIDWIVRAISHDKIKELNVFSNDVLKKDHKKDYDKFQEVISRIDNIRVN